MADVYSAFGDDGFSSQSEDWDTDMSDPDARLTLVEKLEKYVDAEHVYSRQMAARSVLRTLQSVEDVCDAQRVLAVILKIADDPDGPVRAELLDQFPHIALFINENRHLFPSDMPSPFSTCLLPLLLKHMKDTSNQVRKTSHAAMLLLLEHNMVSKDELENQVVPVVLHLAETDHSDDFRSEAAALICKMAPVLGGELMERLLLESYLQLCTDSVFHVRKVCAVSFGDVCSVVGQRCTEQHLLQKFCLLCEDSIWGVRKACAECFSQVSSVCSPAVRKTELSQLFINLIYDQSRWVRMAAFEALGSFIATFADPNTTGLYLSNGVLTVQPANGLTSNIVRDSGKVAVSIYSSSRSGVVASLSDKSSSRDYIQQPDDDGSSNIAADVTTSHDSGHVVGDSDEPHLVPLGFDVEEHADGNVGKPEISVVAVGSDTEPTPVSTGSVVSFNKSLGMEMEEQCTVNSNSSDRMLNDDDCTVDVADSLNAADHPLTDGCTVQQECKVLPAVDACCASSSEISDSQESGSSDVHPVSLPSDVTEVGSDITDVTVADVEILVEVQSDENSVKSSNEVLLPDQADRQQMTDSASTEGTSTDPVMLTHSDNLASNADVLVENTSSQSAVPGSSVVGQDDPPAGLVSDNLASELSESCTVEQSTSEETPSNVVQHSEVSTADFCQKSEVLTASDSVDESEVQPMIVEVGSINSSDVSSDAIPLDTREETGNDGNDEHVSMDVTCDVQLPLSTDNAGSASVETPQSCSAIIDDSSQSTSVQSDGARNDEGCSACRQFRAETVQDEPVVEQRALNTSIGSQEDVNLSCLESSLESVDDEQTVVPRDLLNHYLGMMDPSCALTVDNEVTRHCAYSLPAVAFTLGRRHWTALRSLYQALASDCQWKVRRTLAFSIHEMALIVGEDITSRDLVPVFDSFLSDLDEVRIGVLKHLADFIRLLPETAQQGYLLKLTELLNVDNSRNWRFREELANQLCLLVDIYNPIDVQKYICPMAFTLADDHVAQIRLVTLRLLSGILRKLTDGEVLASRQDFVEELIRRFAANNRWNRRQMFVQLCDCVLSGISSPSEASLFAIEFLPTLLLLHTDRVPNVRISLARLLVAHSSVFENLCGEHDCSLKQLIAVIEALKDDKDRDVRYTINQATLSPMTLYR